MNVSVEGTGVRTTQVLKTFQKQMPSTTREATGEQNRAYTMMYLLPDQEKKDEEKDEGKDEEKEEETERLKGKSIENRLKEKEEEGG